MTALTFCDGCHDAIDETVCLHQDGHWCADCVRCGDCLLELADATAQDAALAGWKGEA